MTMPRCFECKHPVLGLRGQDTMLDTFYLDKSHQDLIDANAFGECHIACLAKSKWVDRWIKAIRQNFEQVRRFALVSSGPAWVYRIHTTKELFIVYPAGRLELLRPSELKTIGAGGSKIDVIEQLMVDFEPSTRKRVLMLGHRLERLPWLLDELEVRDRLLEPTAVEYGTFHVIGSDARSVQLELAYSVELGHAVAEQVRRAVGS